MVHRHVLFHLKAERFDHRLAVIVMEDDSYVAQRTTAQRVKQRSTVVYAIDIHGGPYDRLKTCGVRILSVAIFLEGYEIDVRRTKLDVCSAGVWSRCESKGEQVRVAPPNRV